MKKQKISKYKMLAYANGVQKLSDTIAGKFRHGNIDDPIETRRVWQDVFQTNNDNSFGFLTKHPGVNYSKTDVLDSLKYSASMFWPVKEHLNIPDSHGDIFKPGWLNIDPEKLKDIPNFQEELLWRNKQHKLYSHALQIREVIENNIAFLPPENKDLIEELKNYEWPVNCAVITRNYSVYKNVIQIDLGLKNDKGFRRIDHISQLQGVKWDKAYVVEGPHHYFSDMLDIIKYLDYRKTEIIYINSKGDFTARPKIK